MENSTEVRGGHQPPGSELPLGLSLDGSGREPGSMERIGRVWHLQLPPLQKLAAVYIASSGVHADGQLVRYGSLERLAEFMGVEVERARFVVAELVRAEVFR